MKKIINDQEKAEKLYSRLFELYNKFTINYLEHYKNLYQISEFNKLGDIDKLIHKYIEVHSINWKKLNALQKSYYVHLLNKNYQPSQKAAEYMVLFHKNHLNEFQEDGHNINKQIKILDEQYQTRYKTKLIDYKKI
jgi:hypothetical protein